MICPNCRGLNFKTAQVDSTQYVNGEEVSFKSDGQECVKCGFSHWTNSQANEVIRKTKERLLESKTKKLQSQLKSARAVIGFYAIYDETNNFHNNDVEIIHGNIGKRARQWLKDNPEKK